MDSMFLICFDSLQRPNCKIIGCLRASEASFLENMETLEFMNRLDVLSDPDALPSKCEPIARGC